MKPSINRFLLTVLIAALFACISSSLVQVHVNPPARAHIEALYKADNSLEHADTVTGPIYARDIRNNLRHTAYGIAVLVLVTVGSLAAAAAITATCGTMRKSPE